MKKIECIIRSEKLKDVTDALLNVGIGGMTVSEVRGFGIQRMRPETFLFVHKTKLEIYALDSQANEILGVIMKECFSGRAGDGKIVVMPMDNCIRIRTKDKMDKAII
ncbi:MAG: P-II family nitrogen regulator [Candidatus Omnitrophota bacterium]